MGRYHFHALKKRGGAIKMRRSQQRGTLWQFNTEQRWEAAVTSRYVTLPKLFTIRVQVCSSQSVIENRCGSRRTG